MISLYLGNLGSGKTISALREILMGDKKIMTYTNIRIKANHVTHITADMIVKKELIGTKKSRLTKVEVPIYKYSFNKDFWKDKEKPLNFVLDEAHLLMNPRRSMSNINIIMTDFISIARKLVEDPITGKGNLIFITQIWNRVDSFLRAVATQIRYHTCFWYKVCLDCGIEYRENSDLPNDLRMNKCYCGSTNLVRDGHRILVYHFTDINSFLDWKLYGSKTWYRRRFIEDVVDWFDKYDTTQWEDLLSEYSK